MTTVYLLLGLGLMGGLFWALTQINARQRHLNAEMTRLERLSAEVSLHAEAILEQVDERMDRLTHLLSTVEQAAQPPAIAPAEPDPVVAEPVKRKRGRPRKHPLPGQATAPVTPPPAPTAAPVAQAATAAPAPTPLQKYQELRPLVFSLADQGQGAAEIAQTLGVPRGEVQLILNLRAKKVTA